MVTATIPFDLPFLLRPSQRAFHENRGRVVTNARAFSRRYKSWDSQEVVEYGWFFHEMNIRDFQIIYTQEAELLFHFLAHMLTVDRIRFPDKKWTKNEVRFPDCVWQLIMSYIPCNLIIKKPVRYPLVPMWFHRWERVFVKNILLGVEGEEQYKPDNDPIVRNAEEFNNEEGTEDINDDYDTDDEPMDVLPQERLPQVQFKIYGIFNRSERRRLFEHHLAEINEINVSDVRLQQKMISESLIAAHMQQTNIYNTPEAEIQSLAHRYMLNLYGRQERGPRR
jgi:hypothetical protein